ncbi:MAG: HAMP domain-containing protein [Acidobacteria bacterium]|nr:HAMP domain-containing protein [Acidobacteriota bacterium]
MMPRSLFARLTLALAGILFILGAGFLLLTVRTSQMYEQEMQQRLHRELAAHVASVYELFEPEGVNQQSLETLFTELMHVNPAIEVYLLNPSGEILSYSAPEGQVVRSRVSLAPVQRFLESGPEGPIVGDDPRSDGTKVFSAAPVTRDGVLLGYMYVVLASQIYDGVAGTLAQSYMLRLAAWIALAVLLLSALAGAVLFYRMTRPLAALDEAMRAFTGSMAEDDSGPDRSPERDEIGGLQSSFDEMAATIRRQVEALGAADRSRRELVANVSHDLRTPLAHMTGYLETLRLQWDDLPADRRAEYLEVAVRHGERLSGLVDELFEISRLDTLEDLVRLERFCIDELVRDVARRYRLVAERRGIEFATRVPVTELEMDGDPQLIERSLSNLLDNAMRHTPDGGTIEVAARRESGRVLLSIRDTGEGIPVEEQGRVFERFYRGSTHTSVGGGGLGLAIAKRAIELHRGEIDFSSAPGLGTTFHVELPAAV